MNITLNEEIERSLFFNNLLYLKKEDEESYKWIKYRKEESEVIYKAKIRYYTRLLSKYKFNK